VKIKSALLGLMVSVFMLLSCSISYPQEVEVRVNYSIPAGADSSKIVLWVGDNPAQCPLFEDGVWEDLNLTNLVVTDIIPTSTQHSYILNQPGKSIKIAIVVFDYGMSSPLATTSFYVLPVRPGKATIISVQIIIP
jgi:hypothetical protein